MSRHHTKMAGPLIKNQMGGMVISKKDFSKDHFKSGSNIKEDYEIGAITSSHMMGEIHSCVHHR